MWTRSAQILLVACLAGCTTHLTHLDLKGATSIAVPGFEYYLVKQRYKITVTYQLVSCKPEVQVKQTAAIVETNLADPTEHHFITYGDMESMLKNVTFTASNYPNLTLHTVGATVEDTSGAAIKSALGTAIAVAKAGAGIPATATGSICTEAIHKTFREIEAYREQITNPKTSKARREILMAKVEKLKEGLTAQVEREFEPARGALSLDIALDEEQVNKWFVPGYLLMFTTPQEKAEAARYTRSQVVASPIGPLMADDSLYTTPDSYGSLEGRRLPGVVYRAPVLSEVRVCIGTCPLPAGTPTEYKPIATLTTTIAQIGRHVVFTLKNSAFDKNNFTLAFAANGTVESFQYGSEGSLPKILASVSDSAVQIEGYVDKVRAAQAAAATSAAGAELKAITDEMNLVKAQADLIEQRRRLEALRAGVPPPPVVPAQ